MGRGQRREKLRNKDKWDKRNRERETARIKKSVSVDVSQMTGVGTQM